MGLDVVELAIDLEDLFDVQIPGDDFDRLETVGDLYAYIIKQLDVTTPTAGSTACPSIGVFCRIRRKLVKVFSRPRSAWRPTSRLQDLIPFEDRRIWWHRLQNVLGLKLPELRRPRWAEALLIGSSLTVGTLLTGFGAFNWPERPELLAWLFGVCFPIAIFCGWLVHRITRSCAVHIPPHMTVATLVCSTIVNEYRNAPRTQRRLSPEETWRMFQMIVCDHVGVPPAKLTPQSRIIDLALESRKQS